MPKSERITSIVDDMTDAARDGDRPNGLTVVPIDEAIRLAKPLPSAEELAIEGLTDDEWDAFMRALNEQ